MKRTLKGIIVALILAFSVFIGILNRPKQVYASEDITTYGMGLDTSIERDYDESLLHEVKPDENINVGALPSTYDLNDYIYIQVEDQESYGLCWSFSTLTVLETYLAKTYNEYYQFSAIHQGTSDCIEEDASGTVDFDAGGNIWCFLRYITKGMGPVLEEQMPWESFYSASDSTQATYSTNAKTFYNTYKNSFDRLVTVEAVSYFNTTDTDLIASVKQHVMTKGACMTHIYGNTFSKDTSGNYYIPYTTNGSNHAVTIIGWNDNYSISGYGTGAWLAQNSWGSTKTYFYISYYDTNAKSYIYGIDSAKLTSPNTNTLSNISGCDGTTIILSPPSTDVHIATIVDVSDYLGRYINGVTQATCSNSTASDALTYYLYFTDSITSSSIEIPASSVASLAVNSTQKYTKASFLSSQKITAKYAVLITHIKGYQRADFLWLTSDIDDITKQYYVSTNNGSSWNEYTYEYKNLMLPTMFNLTSNIVETYSANPGTENGFRRVNTTYVGNTLNIYVSTTAKYSASDVTIYTRKYSYMALVRTVYTSNFSISINSAYTQISITLNSSITCQNYYCAITLGSFTYIKSFEVTNDVVLEQISYTAENTTVTYDGGYHNINITVTNTASYSIMYGFSSSALTISSITSDDRFKNWTNGTKTIYFMISASGMGTATGSATLQILQKPLTITLQQQNGTYGEAPELSQTAYSISPSACSGDQLNIKLSTSATKTSAPGNYSIEYSFNNTNYKITESASSKGIYTVTKRSISIALQDQSMYYGDTLNLDNTAYTITDGSVVNGDSLDIELATSTNTLTAGANVSIYLKTCNSYYNVSCGTASLTVLARPVTIKYSKSAVYGEEVSITASEYRLLSGSVVSGDTLVSSVSTTATKGANVGNYPIKILESNSNYDIKLSFAVFAITERKVTLTVNSDTKIYGDAVKINQNNYTIDNLYGEDKFDVTLATSATATSPVGDYSIYPEYTKNSNYSVTVNNGTLKVIRRAVILQYIKSFVYGDEIVIDGADAVEISDNIIDGDSLELTLTSTAKQYSGIGDYSVSLNSCNSNYVVTIHSKSKITITPRPITVTIGNKSKIYGDSVSLSGISINLSEVLNNDDINYLLESDVTQYSDVGTYVITMTYSNQNYNITVKNGTFSVTQRPITIKVIKTFTYGDPVDLSDITYSVLSGSIVNNDQLNLVVNTNAKQFSPVNTYNCYAVCNKNYSVTLNSASKITIVARPITIKIGDGQSQYGEEIDLSKIEIDTSEVLNNDELNIKLTTTATSSSPRGSYTISMASYSNDNYIVSATNGVYRILNKLLSIIVGNSTSIYGEAVTIDQTNYSIVGEAVDKSDLQVKLATSATSASVVGGYEINVASYNTNYDVDIVAGTHTITTRPITISYSFSSVYGDTISLKASKYTVISGTIVNKDTLVEEISCSTLSAIGKYPLTIVKSNANYNITLQDSYYEITKRAVTISTNQSAVYGDDIVLDKNSYSIKSGKVVSGDTLIEAMSTEAKKGSPVGSYSITIDKYNDNYTLTLTNSKFTINQRSGAVTIKDKQITYGDEIVFSTADWSASNIVAGDELNIELSTTANSKTNVGKYSITYKYSNPNYTLTFNLAYVTISKRNATLALGNLDNVVYGSNFDINTIKITLSNVLDGDNLGIVLSTNANSRSNVGKYSITATCKNENYDVAISSGNLQIVPKPITICVNLSGYYGDEPYLVNCNYLDINKAVLSGDALNIEVSSTVKQFSPVGKYEISLIEANPNYRVTLTNSNYEVISRPITITIGDISIVYGETVDETKIVADLSQVLNGDDLGLDYIYSVDNKTPVGDNYQLSAESSNLNYNLTVNVGKITVTPRYVEISVENRHTYGETISEINQYNIMKGEIVNNDDLMLSISSTISSKTPIGEYKLTATSGNGNYFVMLSENSKIIIVPREISVVLNKTIVYGDKIGLTDSHCDIKTGSLVNRDLLVNVIKQNFDKLDAGFYPFTILTNKVMMGEKEVFEINSNYTLELVGDSGLNISAREIIISLGNMSKLYSEDIELNQVYYEIENLIDSDEINLSLSTLATKYSDVGSYAIDATIDNTNYSATIQKGIYTIKPLPVVIEIVNQQVVYGESIGKLDFSCTTEGIEKQELGVVLSCDAKQYSNVGDYTIELVSFNSNYAVYSYDGKLTIQPRKLKIELQNQTKGHFTFIKPNQSAYKLIDGEILQNDDLDIEISAQKSAYVWWGDFTLSAKSNNGNYEIEFVEAQIHVKYSAVDTTILIILGAIVLVLIILAIIKRIKKAHSNINSFYNAIDYLNKNNNKE